MVAILLALLIMALACNFPAAAPRQLSASEEERLQTLVAELYATALAATPAPVATQLPGPPAVTAPADPVSLSTPTFSAPVGGRAFGTYTYVTQSGDTAVALAKRFEVETEHILSPQPLPIDSLLPPGQILTIPDLLGEIPYPAPLLPDSEVLDSPSTVNFYIHDYVEEAGGYLSAYAEVIDKEWFSGAGIVERVARESSTNPRLLLALLEYRSQWVFGQPANLWQESHPLGFSVPGQRGLYKELQLAAKQLNIGYYGWRSGYLTELAFPDGSLARLSPDLNAGSVALQYLFSKMYRSSLFFEELYGADNFLLLHQRMFGDPWERAAAVEPLFPAGLSQPDLELPFSSGERWSLTGGPHLSWGSGTPRGALDFAPVTGEPACAVSRAWVTASAAGEVVRSERGLVVVDLDGDGYEQTGWVLLYLHIADRERVPFGTKLNVDDPLGHPSCEGGNSTGSHVHIARKYNGEWLPAVGPLPFVMSGWEPREGDRSYEGILIKGDEIVSANPGGSRSSIIVR